MKKITQSLRPEQVVMNNFLGEQIDIDREAMKHISMMNGLSVGRAQAVLKRAQEIVAAWTIIDTSSPIMIEAFQLFDLASGE